MTNYKLKYDPFIYLRFLNWYRIATRLEPLSNATVIEECLDKAIEKTGFNTEKNE